MRKPVTEEMVEHVYASVFECLERCQEVHRLWAGVYNDDEVRNSPPWGKETLGRVAALVTGMRELRSRHRALAEGLQPFEWELPSLLGTAVRESGITASSWTEGILRLAGRLSENVDQWERLADQGDKERRDLVNGFSHLTPAFMKSPDFALFRANAQVEASKMLERARSSNPEVRFAYEFQNLKPTSRCLFEVLAYSQGRRVKYQRIAEEVYGDPNASNDRINKAMSRLKGELRRMGSARVADAIVSERGAYCLRD